MNFGRHNIQCVTLVEADASLGRVLTLIQVFSVRSLTHRGGHNIVDLRHIAIGDILTMRSSNFVHCLLKSSHLVSPALTLLRVLSTRGGAGIRDFLNLIVALRVTSELAATGFCLFSP